MDYRHVRQTLQAIRFERKMSVPELAEEAGIAKTTIYRLEEISEEPDRAVDMDTIERLTAALDITLSDFFIRIEGLRTPALAENTASPTVRSDAHGSPALPGNPLDDHHIVIARNTEAFVHLARTIDALATELRSAREQAAATRDRKPARAARSRKTG